MRKYFIYRFQNKFYKSSFPSLIGRSLKLSSLSAEIIVSPQQGLQLLTLYVFVDLLILQSKGLQTENDVVLGRCEKDVVVDWR